MRIAVIDLGTNTFNLLIADRHPNGTCSKLYSCRIPVKLGEGSINKGYISEIPFERGIKALQEYRQLINDYKAEHVKAMATSAIRSAKNGQEFVNEARLRANIDVEVIDGLREAELIYYGNRAAVKMSDSNSLIMDIGGGSTEFVIGNKVRIIWKESYLLGAARLMQLIQPSDPIRQNEIEALYEHFNKELLSLRNAIEKYGVNELIGSSGAFDSIVDIMAGEYGSSKVSDNQTEYPIDLPNYFKISDKIIGMTYDQRLKVKGLIEMRVDMITISCLFVNYILNEFKLKQLRASTYSLKEGVIFSA
jgi:exopolyphosphatase/guanosine-5'-triphosphate,3'-diphosphate pyrophosphatase